MKKFYNTETELKKKNSAYKQKTVYKNKIFLNLRIYRNWRNIVLDKSCSGKWYKNIEVEAAVCRCSSKYVFLKILKDS